MLFRALAALLRRNFSRIFLFMKETRGSVIDRSILPTGHSKNSDLYSLGLTVRARTEEYLSSAMEFSVILRRVDSRYADREK